MKHITVSAAIIHDDQNRIFATQRGSGDWKDWWEFPGGKIEPGETAEEAVRREIWEELETRITVGELLHTIEWDYPKFHLTMHCFLCTIESGSLTLLEHEAARWLAPNELDSVQWLPADWEVIEILKRRMAENDSQAPTQKDTHTKEPVYTLLGESGLVEDEEGNIFSASEISKLNESQDSNLSSPSSAFHSFGVSSVLDDKANPAHWYHHYDPRYCGPSREAFMEEMARKYRHPSQQTTEKETTSTSAVAEPIKGTIPKETIPKETVPKETVHKEIVHKETVPKEIVPDVISDEAKRKANQEQAEVERCGLHPTYREAFSYNFPGLNFVAIVDREGTVIISNDHYLDISFYSNGLARAQSRETRKFGFVDRQGKEVIPCTWRSAGLFSEYLAGVQNDNYRCGYVDVTGRLVIPCVWKETWPFQERLARVQDESRRIGMIDQSGKTIIPCVWKSMGDFSEGLAGVQDENGKCGFIDKTGKIVIPCQWKNVWSFCEGLAVVQDFNKRLGFINKSGELVIPCRWKKVNYFQNGRAKVSDSKNFLLQDKWVYIDKEGRIIP